MSNESWKSRPINGFEKYLFPNHWMVKKHRTMKKKIDPARMIYPRDAMGNSLVPLGQQNTLVSPPLYLPNYDAVKPRAPHWTIKNLSPAMKVVHKIGPMMYDTVNDRSQSSCQSGWTQLGRSFFKTRTGLTAPFYDIRAYKQIGGPYSKHAIILPLPRPACSSKREPLRPIEVAAVATENLNDESLAIV